MKKDIQINLTSKEAMELLAHPATSKKIHTKIISALRDGAVYPKGALASATAQAKKAVATKKPATTQEAVKQ